MRRFSALLFTICYLSFTASLAFAHGTVFFEFAPDAWASTRLTASAGETPYQLFSPRTNLTLTAIDLWIDNTGEAGEMQITLADSEGTTLDRVAAPVAELPPVPGGNKFHINLSKDVALRGGATYSIKIESSLIGLGLYYGNRISVIEHNRSFVNEYSEGAARLGQEIQAFSFKFALRVRDSSGNATDDARTTPPAASTEVAVSITNAHLAGMTPTTATFAWTTNIAADTRVALRTQLNPLYVIASGADPTLELEHYITISGLIPNVNYFADVFSAQGSALLLTTYTIGFRTPARQTVVEPQQPTTPDSTQQQAQQQNQAQNQSPINSSSPSQQQPASASNTNGTNATGTSTGLRISSKGTPTITWDTPTLNSPIDGYRVDIFDKTNSLVNQTSVSATEHSLTLKDLGKGQHTIIVYAHASSTYQKVAPAKSILVQSNDMGLTLKIIGVALLWAATWAIYFWFKFKREKTVLPPEEGYDPNQ